jgi:hypothetical protein
MELNQGYQPEESNLDKTKPPQQGSVFRNDTRPNLGCATTRELIDEIKVRIEIDGNLDYKTTDSD